MGKFIRGKERGNDIRVEKQRGRLIRGHFCTFLRVLADFRSVGRGTFGTRLNKREFFFLSRNTAKIMSKINRIVFKQYLEYFWEVWKNFADSSVFYSTKGDFFGKK